MELSKLKNDTTANEAMLQATTLILAALGPIICLTDMGGKMDWNHHSKQVIVNDFKGTCAVIGRRGADP